LNLYNFEPDASIRKM